MTRRDSSSISPMTILIFFVVGFMASAIIKGISKSNRVKNFDQDFNAGRVLIGAQKIPLGGSGYPETSKLPEWIPDGSDELLNGPRLYEIKGCKGLSMPDNSESVFASTSFYQPDLVEISVPPQLSGTVNVCVPQGTQIVVVLWAK